MTTYYLIGIVLAYLFLKHWRSEHPVFFALIWPVGLLVVVLTQLTHRQAKPQPQTFAPPPPPPPLGGIGTADDHER